MNGSKVIIALKQSKSWEEHESYIMKREVKVPYCPLIQENDNENECK